MASTAAGPETLTFAAARDRVLGAVRPLDPETVPLARATRRALRARVSAPHPLPPFRNASMDGYAVRSRDLAAAGPGHPVELTVTGVIPAGRTAPRPIAAGEAMRIMTGAEIPDSADAVVAFEDAESSTDLGTGRARFVRPASPGENVRDAGADLAAGAAALEAGRELSPHDVALLAALGHAAVSVGPRPRVAIVSTGDELLPPEAALRPGTIRDSNVPMLAALLDEAGCEVADTARVPDDPAEVAARVRSAAAGADVVLSIGGVSAGDFDPVKQALGALGDVALWRVAMKPGRPQAFGTIDGRPFFGLPGNPASVACVFETLVRPALRRMQGFAAIDRPTIEVRAATAVASRAGRTDFVRATLAWKDGAWWAAPAGAQISGHLVPQSRAHVLLVVPEAASSLEQGDVARAIVLRWPETASG